MAAILPPSLFFRSSNDESEKHINLDSRFRPTAEDMEILIKYETEEREKTIARLNKQIWQVPIILGTIFSLIYVLAINLGMPRTVSFEIFREASEAFWIPATINLQIPTALGIIIPSLLSWLIIKTSLSAGKEETRDLKIESLNLMSFGALLFSLLASLLGGLIILLIKNFAEMSTESQVIVFGAISLIYSIITGWGILNSRKGESIITAWEKFWIVLNIGAVQGIALMILIGFGFGLLAWMAISFTTIAGWIFGKFIKESPSVGK
jgi:uncharacterized membrane protein